MAQEEDREAVFMVTEACNSNCVMCPMSSDQRRRGLSLSREEAQGLLDQIDEQTEHIDITGGEPFLQAELVLDILHRFNGRWPQIPVQVLTNGRALCIPRIQRIRRSRAGKRSHSRWAAFPAARRCMSPGRPCSQSRCYSRYQRHCPA